MIEKSDPYGFAAELPPRTASKVADLDRYQWNDDDWMDRRRETQLARRADLGLRSAPGQLAARSATTTTAG